MKIPALARYLTLKYAQEEMGGDSSFGVLINPTKTRLLKDKLILVYDKIQKGITSLPSFIKLNEELGDQPMFQVFKDLINNFVVNIENASLKDGFSYAVRMIEALNELRNALIKMKLDRDKLYSLDVAIKSVQDTIWKEGKRILNIHDLRGLELDYPELKGILSKIVPTWDYGPGKSPVKGLVKKHRGQRVSDLMKRLMKENKEEETK